MVKRGLFKQTLLLILLLSAHHANALNLLQAYELALSNDPQYRAAMKEYEAGLNNLAIGRSAVLPKLGANYNRAANQATQWGAQYSGGPNISNQWSYPSDFAALQVTQPLFNLDALARWRQGAAQTDFSTARFLYTSQELLIRVLQAYTDYLYALDQYRFQQAERDSFAEQVKVAQRLLAKGEGSKIEVLEAESAFYLSDAKLLDAVDLIELNKKKLAAVIGRPLDDKEKVASLASNVQSFTPISLVFSDYRERALAGNLELQAANHQVQIAQQEYQKMNAGHYPVMNMVAAMTTQKSNTVVSINQTTNQNYIGIQLTLPIYSGNEVTSRAAQAYSNFEKSKADSDVIKDKVLIELRKQFDLLVSGSKKINALAKANQSAKQLVEAMNRNVQAGERIYLETLLAQKNLFNTSRDLSLAKYNYLLAYLKLKHMTGDLAVTDFQYVATFFK